MNGGEKRGYGKDEETSLVTSVAHFSFRGAGAARGGRLNIGEVEVPIHWNQVA